MPRKTLRYRDGFTTTTPWLRSEVRRLQWALQEAGHDLDTDGFFGRGTETELKKFQQNNGLSESGVADAPTWELLETFLEPLLSPRLTLVANIMPGFRGDLDWIHDLEGHKGKAYWPKGKSGVTLDPGVDLGYVDQALFRKLYEPVLVGAQLKAAEKVFGITGSAAEEALDADPVLQGIRISREQADEIMPFAAKPYWADIAKRFPALKRDEAFPAVQTVLLSLAYNRGPNNKGLNVLTTPLDQGDWQGVADLVGTMQQDHPQEGIRYRRRWEANLIRSHLGLI